MFCQKEREIMLSTCLLIWGKYIHTQDKLKANESGYLCQAGQQGMDRRILSICFIKFLTLIHASDFQINKSIK